MDDITACTLDLYFTCGHIEYMEHVSGIAGSGFILQDFSGKRAFFFSEHLTHMKS